MLNYIYIAKAISRVHAIRGRRKWKQKFSRRTAAQTGSLIRRAGIERDGDGEEDKVEKTPRPRKDDYCEYTQNN